MNNEISDWDCINYAPLPRLEAVGVRSHGLLEREMWMYFERLVTYLLWRHGKFIHRSVFSCVILLCNYQEQREHNDESTTCTYSINSMRYVKPFALKKNETDGPTIHPSTNGNRKIGKKNTYCVIPSSEHEIYLPEYFQTHTLTTYKYKHPARLSS